MSFADGSHCYLHLYTKSLFYEIFLDKYEINHAGDGQTDRKSKTEVGKGKIYVFVRSNAMNPGVTQRWTLMTWVSQNVGH